MEKMRSRMERIRTWRQEQSMQKRCILSCAAGFIMETLLFGLAIFAYIRSGGWLYPGLEYFLPLFPMFTCLIINLLNEDFRPSLAASAGAAISVFAICFLYYKSSVFTAFLVFFSGFCFYQGRKKGIIAAVLRVVCLVPVFFYATNQFGLFSVGYRLFLIVSAIICFLITGRKNALTPAGISALVISVILACTSVVNILMFIVYLIFNPNYYP